MRSPLITDKKLRERREHQRLFLLRCALLRSSIQANNARDAGQTIIHPELTPREEAQLLKQTNWIRDDLDIEEAKFPAELD